MRDKTPLLHIHLCAFRCMRKASDLNILMSDYFFLKNYAKGAVSRKVIFTINSSVACYQFQGAVDKQCEKRLPLK